MRGDADADRHAHADRDGDPTPTRHPDADRDRHRDGHRDRDRDAPPAARLPAPPTPTRTRPIPRPATRPRPTAIADFTTLPAASKCVRDRKLTVRFKRPPKGYTVKTVTVKVNAKRVATLKGKQLKKPLYLRKLPNGTFTVTVSIKLTKGKGLTERRRYTACK